ncbi:MAG: 4Fe-4S dicluster domain-containing protein [Thermodesulfobacteriota bacterium]|nr:MAG: 4Fe-4S dicluster domain-containing protein [Thermodesulfobacteriota bacterium]
MEKTPKFKYLPEKALSSLVKGLLKEYKVYGTIEKDGFPAFGEVSDADELKLTQSPSHLSAKGFLFPQREVLLKFNMQTSTHVPVIEAERQVLFGLHPCDIRALALMDRVFAHGVADPNYLFRREHTIVIGADCMPDEYCFCDSLGNNDVEDGFDLFLHKISGGYLVRVGSDRGAELLEKHSRTREPGRTALIELEEAKGRRRLAFRAKLDAPPEELPAIYARSDESRVWERIGAICTGCGSCNNVCPTCYCFDVKDEVGASLAEGERVRSWDGCTLEDFAKVAGGHNFRKTRAERLRHRFNRKFRYLTDTFDSLFCVGCGRCSRSCLVKINIVDVTNELIRENAGI